MLEGYPTNGFYKNFMNSVYSSQVDPSPQEQQQFPEQFMPGSGTMYVRGGIGKPAPTSPYPVRKMEFPDGTSTWTSPTLQETSKRFDWVFWLAIICIIILVVNMRVF
jgi:hypothetical protein